MPLIEAAGLAAAKFAAGKIAGKTADGASERVGVNSTFRSAKRYLTGDADIAVNDSEANQILRNTVKYMFYKNFIMGKNPSQPELNTMLDLLAITIHRGNIEQVLKDMNKGENNTNFYDKDYSFLNEEEKKTIMHILTGIDPSKRTIEELPTGRAILGAEGGGKKHKRGVKKRKTKKRSKKRISRKKRSKIKRY